MGCTIIRENWSQWDDCHYYDSYFTMSSPLCLVARQQQCLIARQQQCLIESQQQWLVARQQQRLVALQQELQWQELRQATSSIEMCQYQISIWLNHVIIISFYENMNGDKEI